LLSYFSGKISCPELDYRCIDPNEFCCDPETNFACKVAVIIYYISLTSAGYPVPEAINLDPKKIIKK
jgi:hypothetical protein